MKKVLYITNIEVPYRVRFFNELAKYCDLTVLYESRGTEDRNKEWAKSECASHKIKYLRSRVDVSGIIREIFSGHDKIIVGCYNDPVQMVAILVMRLLRKPYILNLDGEAFLDGNNLKSRMKRFFLKNAEQYLVAGEKAGYSLRKVAGKKKIVPYYFSSLSEQEIKEHFKAAQDACRDNVILVVGQYFDYKGMDIALEAARMDTTLHYKFVGMGNRTKLFMQNHEIPENVEIIPFLQKGELEDEYKKCTMLVLPSRQECWGLVINEAASFGTPIVSTWGSGAAVDFLADEYPHYLAKPADPESLYRCICDCINAEDKQGYCAYLLNKSEKYTIEANAKAYLAVLAWE